MDNLALLSSLAFLPTLVIGILLVGLRWPAKYVMPIGYVVVVVALTVWEVGALATVRAGLTGISADRRVQAIIVGCVPNVLVAVALGPEFPSLLGGLIGLAIVVTAAKRGFLMPDKPWDFPPKKRWADNWMGTLSADPVTPRQKIGMARS